MANYETHKNIGIISSFSITIIISIIIGFVDSNILENRYIKIENSVNIYNIILMILFGYIGSIFPDIDLSTSKPLRIFKNILYGVVVILLIVFIDSLKIIIGEFEYSKRLLEYNNYIYNIVLIGSLVIVPYFLVNIFFKVINKLTHHRGIIHSIPFAFLISLLIYIALNSSSFVSIKEELQLNTFFIALLFFIGNIVHFVLDEIYSVDFRNKRIKKSFSTALTFFSRKDFKKYLFIYFLILMLVNFYIYSFINYNKLIII